MKRDAFSVPGDGIITTGREKRTKNRPRLPSSWSSPSNRSWDPKHLYPLNQWVLLCVRWSPRIYFPRATGLIGGTFTRKKTSELLGLVFTIRSHTSVRRAGKLYFIVSLLAKFLAYAPEVAPSCDFFPTSHVPGKRVVTTSPLVCVTRGSAGFRLESFVRRCAPLL